MAEFVQQLSLHAGVMSILLVCAALFLLAAGWAAIQFTRATQLQVATNIAIARELSVIHQSITGSKAAGVPAPFMPSSAGVPDPSKGPQGPIPEGEGYSYTDEEMADQEAIRELKRHNAADHDRMTDDELQAQIALMKANGFVEEPD